MQPEQSQPVRPTPERHRHDIIAIPERDQANTHDRPARVETQSQIDRYERDGVLCPGDDADSRRINSVLAEAGRRYFVDAYYAGAVARPLSFSADRVDGSCEALSERHIAAIQRRRHALKALGDGLVPIAEWVCVDDYSAASWALKKGQFARAGITVLRIALTVLAKHYGLLTVQ